MHVSRRQVLSGLIASVVSSKFVVADTKGINPKWECTRQVWLCPDPPNEVEVCKLLCQSKGEASRQKPTAENSAQDAFNLHCGYPFKYEVPKEYILEYRTECKQVYFRGSNCRVECEQCEECEVTCRATFRNKCGCEHAARFVGHGKTLRLAKIHALKQVRHYARHGHLRIACHEFLH